MFCATTLYKPSTVSLYIGASAAVALFALWKIMSRPLLLVRIVSSKFFYWITLFLSLIIVDTYFRIQYGFANLDFLMFIWITVCIFLVFLQDFYDPSEMLTCFAKACLITASAVVLILLITERDLIMAGSIRIGASLSGANVNVVAGHLGIYSLGILFLYIKTKKKLILVPYTITVIFMLLTGSKKVFISIFLGITMYIMYDGIKFKKVLLLFFIVSVLIVAILSNSSLYNVMGARTVSFLDTIGFIENTSQTRDESTSVRLKLINTALKLFMEKPFFGWGYNVTARVSERHFYSHNNYVELLANNGILGFSIYYGMLFFLFIRALKLSKRDIGRYFIIASLLNLLLCDLAVVSYISGLVSYLIPIVTSVYLQKIRVYNNANESKRDVQMGKRNTAYKLNNSE